MSETPTTTDSVQEEHDRAVSKLVELQSKPGSSAELGMYYDQVATETSAILQQAAQPKVPEKSSKVEKEDIILPELQVGETSIVFQRHGKYDRDRDSKTAGSVTPENSQELYDHDTETFDKLFTQPDTYVLFVSSDTQYAGKGFRSLETAEIAQQAAKDSLEAVGLDANERIINFNPDFSTARHDETDQDVRPLAGIREPQIFNPRDVEYITHLQEKHGYGDDEAKTGISPKGWAFHEFDGERDVRETTDAEGEEELIKRTKKTLAVLERYSRVWHASNPDKRLVIWAASHYDTISPLVREVDGVLREENGDLADVYQGVDYGGGVVINIPASPEDDLTLTRRASERVLKLGQQSAAAPLEGKDITSPTKLNQPRF